MQNPNCLLLPRHHVWMYRQAITHANFTVVWTMKFHWCGCAWMTWNSYPNCGQMWMKKLTKTSSLFKCGCLKLDSIALNDWSWYNWLSWGEKMFKTITLCENCFASSNSYPYRVGICWGSPTPLQLYKSIFFVAAQERWSEVSPFSEDGGCILCIVWWNELGNIFLLYDKMSASTDANPLCTAGWSEYDRSLRLHS